MTSQFDQGERERLRSSDWWLRLSLSAVAVMLVPGAFYAFFGGLGANSLLAVIIGALLGLIIFGALHMAGVLEREIEDIDAGMLTSPSAEVNAESWDRLYHLTAHHDERKPPSL